MFEQASRMKLRFALRTKGNVGVEDLWDLPLTDLNAIAKNLNSIIKKQSEEEDFLDERTAANPTDQLRFNIVKHIIGVRKAENQAQNQLREKAQYKQTLLALLEEKQHASLRDMSAEELQAKLESLG